MSFTHNEYVMKRNERMKKQMEENNRIQRQNFSNTYQSEMSKVFQNTQEQGDQYLEDQGDNDEMKSQEVWDNTFKSRFGTSEEK